MNATWQEVAQRMYQNVSQEAGAAQEGGPQGAQGAPDGQAAGGGPAGGGEEVADAEYEVVDEEMKAE